VRRSRLTLAGVVLSAALAPAQADEGMWTFNNFPADKLEKAYGFRPDQQWLDHVRLSSVRLARGCSGSFVSARGLVQSNHHCARDCVEQLSTAANNMTANGFYAREEKDELKCPDVEVNQLIDIIPVTDRISGAISGKDGADFAQALKAEKANIEGECAGKDKTIRCDVVDLYHGGVYDLYKYRRYQDVRLVFAPEDTIAFFGGDPDNFEFPRYDFDVSYMRVYVDGKPLDSSKNYLRYAKSDAQPGDVVFTSGNPGSTHRLDTAAQLAYQRDASLIMDMLWLAELRGELTVFASETPEKARISSTLLFDVENWFKGDKGAFAALVDPTIIKDRGVADQALRAKVDADPALRARYGAAWDDIRNTVDRFRPEAARFYFLDEAAFQSTLLSYARTLVRHAAEAAKPNSERLPEYSDANFPITQQSLLSTAPVYSDLEKLTLAYSLTKIREALGPDDEFVKTLLGKKSPTELAAELVDGTGLANLELRTRLLDDPAAVAASSDPMIRFFRAIDPGLRAVRKQKEEDRDAALTRYSSQIAQARFKLEGTSTYPDATFTPRLSYGSVAGYSVGGKQIAPMTFVSGLLDRATGAPPFKLPPSWIAAQSSLNLRQPMNFVTSNDIVGGNSGSPVINQHGEVVGLVFDGNIESLGGKYGYDGKVNRAVAVSVGMLREGLAKVYHANRIVDELAK
jgi:Peptidase S46